MERVISNVQRSCLLYRNTTNSIVVVSILILIFTSSCLSNSVKNTPKGDTLQPKASNLKESDYPNCYKYGVLLVDSIINNENWKIEWLPNNFIKCQIGKNIDSIEFDIIHRGAFEYGFFNIITQSKNILESKIIHYFNDNVAILTVPDGLGRPYFFYLKKGIEKISIRQLKTDLNDLPALIIGNNLIRTEESYSKNDTIEVRNIFAYKLNLNHKLKTDILITKKYEILKEDGGQYFSTYRDEDLFNFVNSFFCQKRDTIFSLCDK